MRLETERQLFHIAIGVAAILLLLQFGRGFMMAAVFCVLVAGTLVINARLMGMRVPLVQWFEERLERDDVRLPGWGSACYAAGALIAITVLTDVNQIAAVLVALGIGDGLSTLAGMRGSIRLPYNRKKTLEGSAVLFLSSLAAYYFIGPAAVPLALVAALAESVPSVDDNLAIPIACTALLVVL